MKKHIQQKSNVDKIINAGQHLLDLINEVLDLTRIDSNKLDVSIEDVNLSEIVTECLNLNASLAREKAISLADRIPREPHYSVKADPLRLKQALINLISNAIKYGHDQGTVVLNCIEKPGKEIRIEVTDDGPGIPLEKQHLLFQPFEWFEEKQFVDGTGIGLALTRRLVELMHGNTGVESEPGKGSTFWIQLPLANAYCDDKETSGNKTHTFETARRANNQ